MTPTEVPVPSITLDRDLLMKMKQDADEKVGALSARLNSCGPRGNHSVEVQLDYWRGYRTALADVLYDRALIASRSGE